MSDINTLIEQFSIFSGLGSKIVRSTTAGTTAQSIVNNASGVIQKINATSKTGGLQLYKLYDVATPGAVDINVHKPIFTVVRSVTNSNFFTRGILNIPFRNGLQLRVCGLLPYTDNTAIATSPDIDITYHLL